MSSIVREVATKLITIENPLSVPVEVKKDHLTCDTEIVSFNPPSFSVLARSEFGFEVVFRPLLA
jgi:hydrocephalus-inducing protein